MQQNKKRVFFFTLAVLLIFAFVGTVNVIAQIDESGSVPSAAPAASGSVPLGSQAQTNADAFSKAISAWWSSSSFSFDNFAKSFFSGAPGLLQILIFVLVALIIYGLAPYIPFIEGNNWIKLPIVLILSYFATFAITPGEISTLMVSYSALGLLITGIIPFFVVAAISKKAYQNGSGLFVGKILWVSFFLVTIYRWAMNFYTPGAAASNWILGMILVLTLGMFFFEKRVYGMIFNAAVSDDVDQANKGMLTAISAKIQEKEDQLPHTVGATHDQLERDIARLKIELAKAKKNLGP